MNIENEKEKIVKFLKAGLFVLSGILLLALGFSYLPKTVTVFNFSKNQKEIPIYCVNREDKKVALSFDAAWGNEDTREILKILAKHNVRVTFFMTGGWVEEYPEDVKAIAAAGHDLGNHSENHKQMSKLSKDESIEEIMKPHKKVKELTGKDMILFRAPYGDYNNTLMEATKKCGYHCIQWDVDSLDWKDYGVDSIIETILNHKHLGSGSIILCHNGAKFTSKALESVITGLQEKGFEIVPISELIYAENYHIDHEGRQINDLKQSDDTSTKESK